MKKIICVLLLLVLSLLLLVSCDKDSGAHTTQPPAGGNSSVIDNNNEKEEEEKEDQEKEEEEKPAHVHTFVAATCLQPATCSGCGETQGTTIEHTYGKATCERAAACTLCGASNGKKLEHDVEKGQCSMCGLSYYDELRELLFEHGTYDKYNISLNGTLMYEEYTYSTIINLGSDYECAVSISKLESTEDWPTIIFLDFSPGFRQEGTGILLSIDKASVKNQKYNWSYSSGTKKISGQLYAPEFSSSSSLECTNSNCTSAMETKLVENAVYELHLLLKNVFAELLAKSDKGITVAHFGFEHYE